MIAKLRELKLLVPTVMVLVALPILVMLGFWQLERLAWKERIIGEIAARTRAQPVDLAEVLKAVDVKGRAAFDDIEYTRVNARGRFLHDKEQYLYAPDQKSGPGFDVLTPFVLSGSDRLLFVNRGYVPEPLLDRSSRPAAQPEGEVEFIGLLRAPAQPGSFTPPNDPARNRWFWRDYDALITAAFGTPPSNSVGLFVDAESPAAGGYPRGSATILQLPNRHLEYALTWFGLAATLSVVYGLYFQSRLRGHQA